jgi:methionyl-tRNA formyltransferase
MTLVKYVFVQNDPFFLPRVLDTYLQEFAATTAGVNIQSVAQGKRSVFETAMDLYRMYGFGYFQWKLRRYLLRKIQAKVINGWLGRTGTCYSVAAVARKHNVEVTEAVDVNSDEFLQHLRDLDVQFIISISGTQFYGKRLREQTPHGIVNCHGALLPKYRGLMPSFWTLANGESQGGVTVHMVDAKLDNGPILVQKRFPIGHADTLEQIMTRSKTLATEAIVEAVRLVESGDFELLPNDETEATHYSMPTREDVSRFRANGHRFH